MGKESARFTATLAMPGDEIRIEFDVRQRDQYGRLLCLSMTLLIKSLENKLVYYIRHKQTHAILYTVWHVVKIAVNQQSYLSNGKMLNEEIITITDMRQT